MLIDTIANARLANSTEPTAVAIDSESRVGPATSAASPTSTVLDADGRGVLPGFVDAHVHLDKAYVQPEAEAATGGATQANLGDAIAAVERVRGVLDAGEVLRRARLAVDAMVANGTVAARTHVEIGPEGGAALVDLHLALADEVAQRCRLQLAAFPQHGLASAASRAALAAAVGSGLEVVGGCPYADTDQLAHLDVVFGLAERHGLPVDLHVDFDDHPARSILGAVAERTRAHGMEGRVLVGHATSLTTRDADQRRRTLDVLAHAGIGLVVLPFSDLHLVGHGSPGTRSVVDVVEAVDAGVTVAIGTNNLANPFAPSGNASLLHAAWLTAVIQRIAGAAGRRCLLDAITVAPARLLGLEDHGTDIGDRADLVLIDDRSDPAGVVAIGPPVLSTILGGRLVHRRDGVEVHAPEAVA